VLAVALLGLATGACRGQEREDERLQAVVESLVPQLERLAGLEARAPIAVTRQGREEMRAYVVRKLEEELPEEELRGIEATYEALGLLPDTLDLRALMLDLYTEQVVGYYDPESDRLYLIEGVGADALRSVLVHELVHALQDQHMDLDSLVAREHGNDRQTAAQAAIEGHATLVMFALLAEERTGAPVDPGLLPDLGAQLRPALEGQNERFPVFRTAPRIIREALLFPYLQGASFVQALWRASPDGEKRPAPLGENLPASTEQVMWPEARFLEERDPPTELRLGPTPAAAGGAWRTVHENTLGALETSIFLTQHLGAGADTVAFGWDGDRFRLIEAPGGERALVWYSVWDGPAEADRFADAYRRIAAVRQGRAVRIERLEVEGRPVVLVVDADRGVAPEGVPLPPLVGLGG